MGRSAVFGIPSAARGGHSARSRGRFVKRPNNGAGSIGTTASENTTASSSEEKFAAIQLSNTIDEKFGFAKFESGPRRQGWLINMHSTLLQDPAFPNGRSAVDFYFLEDGGTGFKATIPYEPYMLVAVKVGHEAECEEFLRRKFEGVLRSISRITKEDLRMPNHLTGYRRTFLQLAFGSGNDLYEAKRYLMPVVEKNKRNVTAMDTYNEVVAAATKMPDEDDIAGESKANPLDAFMDVREHDVPYHVRVAIDLDIRIGKWYDVAAKHGQVSMSVVEDRLTRADPVIMAFDIETTKSPLKFPDAAIDQIMMISYMIDGQGFLITNREVVSRDIDDFEYTPKPEFQGPFVIFNEADEVAVLRRFYDHIIEARPTVMVTYNGDFFDWPFVETRSRILGIDMYEEIGFRKNAEDVYESKHCVHMDAFAWVKRDSYLPQGSQGLKAVTTAKLGYDPIELDPELMTLYAAEKPQILSQYSVSDAVATYYLYMKYCHPFIFSLCNIIPLNPDDVLRKGTGTLCEMLLMVKAYQDGIVLPNKHVDEPERFFEGHLLDSETYVGGHVESLEAGVFRSDIPEKFNLDARAVQQLLDDLDHALRFSIEVEGGRKLEEVLNYDEIRAQIAAQLVDLRDRPTRADCPKIYHLDVASMYPNIMITNRLQPDSMMDESTCATCDYNRPGKTCDRKMTWSWRGEFFPTKMDEYNMIKRTLMADSFPPRFPGGRQRSFEELTPSDQMAQITKRLGDYSRKVYHKLKDTRTIERETIVCQRENPFYVNTVKSFRDRRYDYKTQQKVWKKNVERFAADGKPTEEAKKMVVLYDSLQLAHKVILNSFYGYVMRKGSRWYSMEMAGVTCLTGATIIQMARQLVEKLGRPLELDTDGIWCILPDAFPENFTFKTTKGPLFISYPCVMLNHLVHAQFTNHAYEELDGNRYKRTSENSIFFEVDGPYKAMILPTSKEENKNLKKRYAVFNHDGTLAELKGFELKRRGELKLIKVFQNQVFKVFLEGATLSECYEAVGRVADKWLDVLYSRGATLADEELIDLVCENRSMSKTVAEYGTLKSTSISTAKRLAEFLGDQMTKDKGLACKYIISTEPRSLPVTERAVPIAIFSAEESIKRHFLRRWLRDPSLNSFDIRNILDWTYYLERFGSVIQKLITMPAAMQKVRNPVPRVAHPEWLNKQLAAALNPLKQSSMSGFVRKTERETLAEMTPNVQRLSTIGSPGKSVNSHNGLKRKLDDRAAEEEAAALRPLLLSGYEGVVEDEDGSPISGYTIWLRHQRRKWRAQAAARARRKKLMGTTAAVPGVLSQLQLKAAQRASSDTYEIVSVEQSKVGTLRCWAIIGGTLTSVKLLAQRQIFVNFHSERDMPDVEIPGCNIAKVSCRLPNGSIAKHAFKISMAEATYRDNIDKLGAIFAHPAIQGVYEQNLPQDVRAIMQIGTTCSFDDARPGSLAKAMSSGFSLEMLKPTVDSGYLENPLNFILLASTAVGERDVVIVRAFNCSLVQLICLDPKHELARGWQLERNYQELLEERQHISETITFQTTVVHTEARLIKALSEAIRAARQACDSPSVVVLSCDKATVLSAPVLSEQPYVCMAAPASAPSTLNWQSSAARQLLGRMLDTPAWVEERRTMAKYSRVPMCNLTSPSRALDIAMARQLKSQDYLLDWSVAGQGTTLDRVAPIKIRNAGAFDTVCVELEVRNLIVSTLLNSALINELEGSVTDDVFVDQEQASEAPTIVAFKALIKNWWLEATQGRQEADVMIDHAVRWVQSPASCMYSHELDLYARRITNKAFMQLIAELRKVGAQVVYGSDARLIIKTSKQHISTALAYANYVVRAIRSRPLFHFIDLQIVEYWDWLIWLDETNFGGYCTREISENTAMAVAMHWNLKLHLPDMLAAVFEDWIVEYVAEMYEAKLGQLAQNGECATQRPSDTDLTAEKERIVSGVIAGLAGPLVKQVEQLVIKYNRWRLRNDESDDTFLRPPRPSIDLQHEHPVLSLTKYLCQVFALVPEGQIANRVLRRDLLALVDVREFSPAGKFEDPAMAVTLERLPCCRCGGACDLKLGRDNLTTIHSDASSPMARVEWHCPTCGTSINALLIQELLIGQALQLMSRYQTQDLRCAGKCKALMTTNMISHCGCAGNWQAKTTSKDMQRELHALRSIGDYFEFSMLQGVLDELPMPA
ncbi:DNA polymerase epsilon catalytic subunit [Savitreella phatthalungensis]